MPWAQEGTALATGFLGSLVECVEALTIILAVGVTRGWRSSLSGALAGGIALLVLSVTLGSRLRDVPIVRVQLVIGVLLLLFGLRWLRKAILRSAGVIPLHDEARIFERTVMSAGGVVAVRHDFDLLAFTTSFKAVVLEGLEVIFIVITTGVNGHFLAAAAGAGLAALIVIVAGALLREPLSQVPENALKYSVGILLSAFGVFWTGEGLQLSWPGNDLALPFIAFVLLIASFGAVAIARKSGARREALT